MTIESFVDGRLSLSRYPAFRRELVNLRVGKQWGAWGLSVWARNLFDEDYATRGFYFGNEPPLFENTLYTKFGDPRSYGITLSYDYGKGERKRKK